MTTREQRFGDKAGDGVISSMGNVSYTNRLLDTSGAPGQ